MHNLENIPEVNILGVGVSAINMQQALQILDHWIVEGERHYVCITGVHGIMESQRDETLRNIHNRAGLVTPDGMPLVWFSRWKGRKAVGRVYGPELMLQICQQSVPRGYKHFFYGGAGGVPELLAEKLTKKFPGLNIVGTYSPPYRNLSKEEDQQITAMINDKNPDIVWVGLSTPKQEHWMSQHHNRIKASVMAGVGAAFDFHAGLKKQAPKWMQRNGLEWLFRLSTEPKRLGKRYLTNNPKFLWAIALQELRLYQYKLTSNKGK